MHLPESICGRHNNSVGLYSCLESFFSEEVVEGVECLNCTLDNEIRRHSRALTDLNTLLEDDIPMPCIVNAQRETCLVLETLRALSSSTMSGCETVSQDNLAMLGVSASIYSNYSKCSVISRWPEVLCLHM